MPRFSVIIPVYNRAEAFKSALASVLAQSVQDFEIVVVDDGSSDDPASAAASFADPRIRVLRQENQGGGAARNAGIDAARGDLIAFLDSDDVFLPDHLAQMERLLAGTNDTVGYAPMIVDRGEGRTMIKPPRAIRANEDMANYLLCDRGFVPTITLVLPRGVARSIRYDPRLPFAQDTDFAIRLALSGCKFAMAAEPGAVWRDAPNPNRVSAGRKGARLIPWLEALRPQIPARAYYGCYGWMIAKGLVATQPARALGYYLRAIFTGCYGVRLAAIIFLQIFFSDALYRRVADGVIALRPAATAP
ncbi:MAG TPA: glycosyltransferase family 2 protein [Rhizomicrobium sp.]|nr:glycosyltransferase family 2 protein [Rhizomicrobium sp.]